jgi:hypothetical protein
MEVRPDLAPDAIADRLRSENRVDAWMKVTSSVCFTLVPEELPELLHCLRMVTEVS